MFWYSADFSSHFYFLQLAAVQLLVETVPMATAFTYGALVAYLLCQQSDLLVFMWVRQLCHSSCHSDSWWQSWTSIEIPSTAFASASTSWLSWNTQLSCDLSTPELAFPFLLVLIAILQSSKLLPGVSCYRFHNCTWLGPFVARNRLLGVKTAAYTVPNQGTAHAV